MKQEWRTWRPRKRFLRGHWKRRNSFGLLHRIHLDLRDLLKETEYRVRRSRAEVTMTITTLLSQACRITYLLLLPKRTMTSRPER